jgi:hypothetical protein
MEPTQRRIEKAAKVFYFACVIVFVPPLVVWALEPSLLVWLRDSALEALAQL